MDAKLSRLDNPKRGCGYLKHNAMYLRADTHPDGTLPPFVSMVPAQPFAERHYRGWKPFQGLALCMAVGQRWRTEPEKDEETLRERIAASRLPDDIGHADLAWAPDLLMWVGGDFYPTPEAFAEEATLHGVNKRIPSVGGPPLVVPGITRLFLVHPSAAAGAPGVFGYTYLTRVVYTTGPGPTPKWVHDLAARGRVDICQVGPEYDPAQSTPLLDGLDQEGANA